MFGFCWFFQFFLRENKTNIFLTFGKTKKMKHKKEITEKISSATIQLREYSIEDKNEVQLMISDNLFLNTFVSPISREIALNICRQLSISINPPFKIK